MFTVLTRVQNMFPFLTGVQNVFPFLIWFQIVFTFLTWVQNVFTLLTWVHNVFPFLTGDQNVFPFLIWVKIVFTFLTWVSKCVLISSCEKTIYLQPGTTGATHPPRHMMTFGSPPPHPQAPMPGWSIEDVFDATGQERGRKFCRSSLQYTVL